MCGVAGEATWGGEKSRQAEQDEYDGSEFMTGGGPAGMQGAQCKQMWTSSNRNISIKLYIEQLLHNYVPKIKVSFQNIHEKKYKIKLRTGKLAYLVYLHGFSEKVCILLKSTEKLNFGLMRTIKKFTNFFTHDSNQIWTLSNEHGNCQNWVSWRVKRIHGGWKTDMGPQDSAVFRLQYNSQLESSRI